jgi:hypothetical protein
MKKTSRSKGPRSAESIARLADRDEDVSVFFTNAGRMMPPLESLGIDLNKQTIAQLDETAKQLNITRQTLIKRFIRRGLTEHYSGQKSRRVS